VTSATSGATTSSSRQRWTAGADIVSGHDDGGVSIGNSLHTNNHVVLDGTEQAAESARRV
jgi:urocanate hydratase